jgi:predicted amidohydrolase YtcJ
MFEPFSDSNFTGLQVTPTEVLYSSTKGADIAGLQVVIHAIGDRANDIVLSVYENVTRENPKRDRRFRIEHAQEVRMEELHRFKDYIASMQPTHLPDDIQWAEKIIGSERIKDLYRFGSLRKNAHKLVFGSDWYVEDPDVMKALYAAVSRVSVNYPEGFQIEERVTIEEALKSYTVDAAYAAFRDHIQGQIKVGYLADFVVLDQDVTSIKAPWTDILNTQVLYTVINGQVVHQK